ncbi:nucleoside hydrolase [Georgenia sp. H159]|uniref:nucleoside hydrolase n=1 Tax=Georgenia sp. H159 TaxID=3076115 RepID=UPI002D77EA75|nr:nucleoside hydrolase [Georgenia sp. H159]
MLIVDTDPGTDDAAAIMTLLASGTKVDAFVSVYGNVAERRTTANLQRLLDIVGEHDAARYRGAVGPLLGDPVAAKHIHGEDGMSGAFAQPRTDLPELPELPELPRVDYGSLIRSAADPVTIIALGPLTNVGAVLAAAPELVEKIERIIFMGGAVLTYGNETPAASFNAANDPTAAAFVYDSGVPIVQVGLDVCRPAEIPVKRLLGFRDSTTPAGQLIWTLLNNHFMVQRAGGLTEDSVIRFNDAPCMAFFLRPELFRTEHLPVVVETEGRYSRGATIADFPGYLKREPNTEVLLGIDVEGYADLVTELLLTYL